jgi:hypothetical protein
MVCRLHAALSNNIEEIKIKINRQHSMWVACHIVKQHGRNKNKNK